MTMSPGEKYNITNNNGIFILQNFFESYIMLNESKGQISVN